MMIALKNEGLEVVRMQHMAVADHNGDLRWMTARFVADCELYAMPDFGRAPDLCRHSEALAGYAVRDARIAELEGLLRHAQKQVPTGSGLHMRIDAALAAHRSTGVV